MTTINNHTPPVAQWICWLALGIGTLTAAFWLLILIDILLCDLVVGCVSVTWDMVLLLFLVVASIARIAIARRWGEHWWTCTDLLGFCVYRNHLCYQSPSSGFFDAGDWGALFDRWSLVPGKLVVTEGYSEPLRKTREPDGV